MGLLGTIIKGGKTMLKLGGKAYHHRKQAKGLHSQAKHTFTDAKKEKPQPVN